MRQELSEAREQQAATDEVLRVISRSKADVQPVFDSVVTHAVRLCAGDYSFGYLRTPDGFRYVASAGGTPELVAIERRELQPRGRGSLVGRVAIEERVIHISDVLEDAEYALHAEQQAGGFRTLLGVPMKGDDDELVGVIGVARNEVRPFNARQIKLVETFAEQAAVAIENVRLFNETKEALERQTALAEILRVISQSPTDVQPVLDAIAESAARFCGAEDVSVGLIDGELWRIRSHHGSIEITPDVATSPLGPTFVSGRSMIERRTIHVPDLQAEADKYPRTAAGSPTTRAILATPLLSAAGPIGALFLRRTEASPFTERQIELAETFAAQAVIAIENVRLFNETNEALKRQTAISEVLDAINSSAFDLEPVLGTVINNAMRLCAADNGSIVRFEAGVALMIATTGSAEDQVNLREAYKDRPLNQDRSSLTGRVLLESRSVQILDTQTDPDYGEQARETARRNSDRTMLGVPLVRSGTTVGIIVLRRKHVAAFTPSEVSLVEAFAGQAVVAMENARLFNETKEALERQTAISEILQIISASPTDVQPVLDAIVENALRFCAAEDALVVLPDGDALRLAAHRGPVPVASDLRYPNDGTSMTSRVFLEARTIAVQDLQSDAEFPLGAEHARAVGHHAVIVAPLLREGVAIGTINLRRFDTRPFSDREIRALEMFATQAVIAIENVRLFNETREALEQQTATADVLNIVSQSIFKVEPVFQAIVDRAARLCAAQAAMILRPDSHDLIVMALFPFSQNTSFDIGQRISPDRTTGFGRAFLDGSVAHIADPAADPDVGAMDGTRLGVPIMRDGDVIGVIGLARDGVRPFSESEIRLIQTFATQAAIAIENTRLFDEIKEKSAELEGANQELAAASRHKSEFLANMSHELRTPLNAIIGFSDVLEQRLFGELNERQAEYTHDIASSGRHLLDLVNEILDLSKVEAGKMELEPNEFDLADTLRGTLAFIRERAARHRIGLSEDVAGDLGTVVADERKVRQVLLNLLSNAVKFTPDGGTIGVRARRTAGEVEVSVRDTGIGIAPEDQAKIFDEFQQVGRPSDRSREGTGLGLTLAKRFIELHGGRIWIESKLGVGTTFTFAIPLAAVVQVRSRD